MLRALVLTLLAAVSACGPAPALMPATRASEVLERFAAGMGGDVCTPRGRAELRGAVRAYGAAMNANGVAELRGAVRAYGAAMNANGVAWPATEQSNSVDASVLVAFSAGFVEASDFHGTARAALQQLAFASWPEVRGMRRAARIACTEVVALQRAAARVVMETERLSQMANARPERLARQRQRVERAHVQMQQQAALVSARVDAARET